MPEKKRKFRLFSAVLATVCIILVGDAVAPTASIGNSQYVWWILMILGFFIPYALISAELGTQYPSEGGMYTWVKNAFGKKWAGRVAWFYWVNFPLWIASLADLITTLLMQMFGIEMSLGMVLGIQIFYIVLVTILGTMRISQSQWWSNFGAIIKFIFLAGLGVLGIYVFITQGSANPINSVVDLIPLVGEGGGFDFVGLGFVSLIIFNMLGFEVVSTFSNDMTNPKKEIPKAIILGGILIAVFYLLPSFGIGVAIPVEEIGTDTGLLESYQILLESVGLSAGTISAIVCIVGGLFIYTLIANISSWTFGVESVVAYAAEDGVFPKSWAKRNKSGVPYVISIWNGVVALVISVAGILISFFSAEIGELFGNPDMDVTNLFWTFFSLSLFTLLVGYLPMFLAFIKLHKNGKQVRKGYWIEGGNFKIKVFGIVPFVLLLIALVFTLFPIEELSWNGFLDAIAYNLPLIIGAGVSVIIGEILVARMADKDRKLKSRRKKAVRARN